MNILYKTSYYNVLLSVAGKKWPLILTREATPGAGFRVLVCYWISRKLQKFLYALCSGVFKNAGDTPRFKKKKAMIRF
ncbi:hypothetical protein CN498_00470 [Bacillus thuringiensis]|nr:hypothetical protein CN498_00470 [Bacillus thuringiensis]PGL44343.1 hypothetical protein CN914_30125 [Bacillus thuringiensis]PGS21735.1 hypothetical protein COC65_28925 [Bacillus thuringiensis]